MRLSSRRHRTANSLGNSPAVLELLRYTEQGDQQAFLALYDLLASEVYGLALTMLRDIDDAQTVTTHVMMELWRTASQRRRCVEPLVTWALCLAHRQAAAHLRCTRHERDDIPPDEPPGTELGVLSDPQRNAIVIAYYGGYTYQQAALLLDATPSCVTRWINTGLARLRELSRTARARR